MGNIYGRKRIQKSAYGIHEAGKKTRYVSVRRTDPFLLAGHTAGLGTDGVFAGVL